MLGDGIAGILLVALQVEEVTDTQTGKFPLVFGDPLEDERVDAIVGPGVIELQTFIHNQREISFIRLLDSKIQGIVVLDALEHLHPVENVASLAVVLLFV